MKSFLKIAAMLVIIAMLSVVFVGCGGGNVDNGNGEEYINGETVEEVVEIDEIEDVEDDVDEIEADDVVAEDEAEEDSEEE